MTKPDSTGEPSTALAQPETKPVIPDHELLRLIGQGGGGQVWLARNVLGTYRAIKIVRAGEFKHRRPFEREFNGIAAFEPVSRLHDGLVNILQVGRNETADYFYYVMELGDDASTGQTIVPEQYIPRTLTYDMTRRRRLPIGECVRLGAALASALGFLHRHDLIHRDIKPSNIIFVNGFPKLADIGLMVGISEDKAYVGTEGFIPPEGPGTVRADIYSMGKVLYEISTGQDRNQYPELPADLKNNEEDRDLIQFNKIVLRACRTIPHKRYKSAEGLMSAILAFQFNTSEAHKERTYNFWATIIGIIGAAVAISVLGIMFWHLIRLLKQGQ